MNDEKHIQDVINKMYHSGLVLRTRSGFTPIEFYIMFVAIQTDYAMADNSVFNEKEKAP